MKEVAKFRLAIKGEISQLFVTAVNIFEKASFCGGTEMWTRI